MGRLVTERTRLGLLFLVVLIRCPISLFKFGDDHHDKLVQRAGTIVRDQHHASTFAPVARYVEGATVIAFPKLGIESGIAGVQPVAINVRVNV